MFIRAKRPDFIFLSTDDSAIVERRLVEKALRSRTATVEDAMRCTYRADMKQRSGMTAGGKGLREYTLSALFSKTKTN